MSYAQGGGALPPIDFVGLAAALLDRATTLVPQWLPAGFERAGRWYVGDFDGAEGKSANVNLHTGTWIDNGGTEDDRGGDLISLYARIHGLNNGQAARELMEMLGWETARRRDAPRSSQASSPQGLAAEAGQGDKPGLGEPETPAGRAPDGAPAGSADISTPVRTSRGRKSLWRAIEPVPRTVPKPDFVFKFHDRKLDVWQELQPVRTWAYEFEGELYGYTARIERFDSHGQLVKDVLPRTWCVDESDGRGTCRWHWKQWEAPRPLYVPAALLSADLSLPVVVVEGEKCAQAGHELLGHEFDFVTWPGGCNVWPIARWGWLMGRKVYLWADADSQREGLTKAERESGADPATKPFKPAEKQPGLKAMVGIGQVLQADHGCEVFLCRCAPPGEKPDGWDIADAIAEGWDAARVRDFIRSAIPFRAVSDEARAKAQKIDVLADADSGDEAISWRGKLLNTEKGAIKACRENAVLALDGMALGDGRWLPGVPAVVGKIAYNEFTNDVCKLEPMPWGAPAGPWDEVDELECGNWLSREHWLPPMSRQTLEEAVSMVARRHRYHPARAHFEGLRGTWDGVGRLRTWLTRCCRDEGRARENEAASDHLERLEKHAQQDELGRYLARVGSWVLMAICARVLQPGCKFDYMLILEGGQGKGKSTLAKLLGVDWFADTGLVLGDKDSYQNLQGVLVYEWGELDSLTRAEVTKVKQFISSQKDRFRASFDRRPKDYPRQVVFIGTTNESHYLSDPTGNRRFWPVRVTRFIDLAWLRDNLPQMFAEALHLLDAGQRYHPTQREQLELFDPQQSERQVENALESAIRRYLYDEDQKVSLSGVNGSLVAEITLADLLTALSISVDKQTAVMAKQASAALGRLGWERGRASSRGLKGADKVRPWVYRRPPDVRQPEAPAGGQHGASEVSGFEAGASRAPATSEGDDDCPF